MVEVQVVEDFEFTPRGNVGKYRELYRALLGLPYGTAVKFSRDEDFDAEPERFATSFRTGLWTKGYRVRVTVRGDDVYVLVVGERSGGNGKGGA